MAENNEKQIKENLQIIHNKIEAACKKCGRDVNSVKLMAVSKFHPAESIIAALNAGQILFGENRVQEAFSKFSEINKSYKTELHIIGQLQSNKVRDAVKIAECIQSVDRIELLNEIEKQCTRFDKNIKILFEVHTAEDSKSGFDDIEEIRQCLNNFTENKYPHITPVGFMTMAPFTENEALIRKSFSTVRNISIELQKDFPMYNLSELSMGMSGDYEIAIEEGSTLVRIGTAIFGEREY